MKKTIKIIIICNISIILLYASLYLFALFTPKLQIYNMSNYTFYDKDNNIFPTNTDEWTKLDNISKNLINATISIEDKHFYSHIGFDYLRIIKAIYTNIKNKQTLEGASTITQQYAKNLYLNFDKTFKRKINEAWLTIRLEVQYTKDEILEGYLNTINYGGVFGIENASEYYFGIKAKDLSIAQAAMLAGIPKSPSYYSPIENFENAKNRQKVVLKSMLNNKYITQEEYENALKEDLNLIGMIEKKELDSIMYYQQSVINELESLEEIPKSLLNTAGLKIYTNLDIDAQKSLEKNINKYYKDSDLEIAGIMVEPNSGKVIALIGGKNYKDSQYNRALFSQRSIGSTIKPFLYYSALENGFTPSSTFTSEKTMFTFSNGEIYSPNNYGNNYANKSISLASAIAYSDNIYAVKTHLFLGEETLVNISKKIGIKKDLEPIPSLALGSIELSLLDLIRGYSTLASGGFKNDLHFINKIEDNNGNILYEYQEKKELVLNPSLVYILNEMLTSTTNNAFIDYTYPTCYQIASKLSNKYSIKSGTTDFDNLIIGYDNSILLGLWSGYDNNNMVPSNNSYNIKNTWADTIEEYKHESKWYDLPYNVIGVIVDPVTGLLATKESKNKTIMYYIKGTEPN